ncbi:TetR/AcrR family transcriptional regulator [Rhodobacter sp. ETT8]|uniref:TetR/AcrR family transcriptional regulator n=2 Tax=Pseudotabrizicola algicola TaxID=2709381 RepID=A0A6B3RTN0_9RHOB|nr:TetR/AcrR family transcriptional regulator [Pseudotabrizicola algicola]
MPLADQRSAEILESARLAFAEKGFDGASMQDIARKAGMSVGNFYRYFPSKSGIVEALIEIDMQEMEQDFVAILAHAQPLQALRQTIERKISEADCQRDGQLWAEITAAAMRKPEIGEAARRMEIKIASHLTTIFARVAGISVAEAEARWAAHAQLLIMLVKTCAMHPPDCPVTPDLKNLLMRNIDLTLQDIATSAAVKG